MDSLGKQPKLQNMDMRFVTWNKMCIGEIGWGVMDWIGLVQDKDRWRALVNAVMNLWVP
jgi:hypothetical protein